MTNDEENLLLSPYKFIHSIFLNEMRDQTVMIKSETFGFNTDY